MNANDLLDLMEEARGKYVLEAQACREENARPGKKSKARILLIAAIVAALLTGCAVVYSLRLERMKIGTEDLGDSRPDLRTVISLQGIQGSSNYNAAMEWYEFLQTYDQDREIYNAMSNEDMVLPEEYYGYQAYSREMADKINEICEKYGLHLHGKFYFEEKAEDLHDTLGIEGIARPGLEIGEEFFSSYFYQDGSFKEEGYFSIPEAGEPLSNPISFGYRCNMKSAFDDVYMSLRQIEEYEQWEYTTENGVPLLLAMGPWGGIIAADRTDAFICLMFDNWGEQTHDRFELSKEEMEVIADHFDFSIHPQSVSDEAVAASVQRRTEYDAQWEETHYKGRESFDAWVKTNLERNSESRRVGYLMVDLNGDGMEELLLGRDGYIFSIGIEREGHVDMRMTLGHLYLCQDNIIADVNWEKGQPEYQFSRFDGTDFKPVLNLKYRPGEFPGSDWRKEEGFWDEGITEGTPVSREEYFDIAASYKRVTTDMVPIEEYPLSEEPEPGLEAQLPESEFTSYQELFEDWKRNEEWNKQDAEEWGFEYEPSTARAALMDLNGDGQEELIVRYETGSQEIYTVLNGRLQNICSGRGITICENGLIQWTILQSGRNKTIYGCAIQDGSLKLVDYIRVDYDRDPANPWFRSSDISGQDTTLEPLSQAEFDLIQERYIPLELETKLCSDFYN